MVVYKYSQIKDEIEYDESRRKCIDMSCKDTCIAGIRKLGQLKLFMSELLFLAKNAKDSDTILYIGAAPGYHINLLVKMFPKCKFELWDPFQSEVKPGENVKIHQSKFNEELAKQYTQQGTDILFLCDIRDITIRQKKDYDDTKHTDTIVDTDMLLQMKWCQIIRPRKAYLKFRLPYESKVVRYLSGTIYMQPYSPLSTEARLSTSNYDKLVYYDSGEYGRKMAYHNLENRCRFVTSPPWYRLIDKYNLCASWDTAYSLYITRVYVMRIQGYVTDTHNRAMKLFRQIIKFHAKKYGKRYDILYTIGSVKSEAPSTTHSKIEDTTDGTADSVED